MIIKSTVYRYVHFMQFSMYALASFFMHTEECRTWKQKESAKEKEKREKKLGRTGTYQWFFI